MRIMAHRARMIDAILSVVDAPDGGTIVSCVLTCLVGTEDDGE